MDSARFRREIDRYYKALNSRQFKDIASIIDEWADDSVVLEYPQSGERIKGKANNLALLENYPGLPDATVDAVRGAGDQWVLTPSWTPLKITGSGDNYSIEGKVAYPNGEEYRYVDLFELRNDRVVKITEYFAAPFPAADWRAKWVEKPTA